MREREARAEDHRFGHSQIRTGHVSGEWSIGPRGLEGLQTSSASTGIASDPGKRSFKETHASLNVSELLSCPSPRITFL